jgi:phosphotransferase system HPr (HPr) family protein
LKGLRLEQKLTVRLKNGLHARPALMICERLKQLDLDSAEIVYAGVIADPRSIMALLSLAAAPGEKVIVRFRGPDAEKALFAVKEALTEG